MRKILLALLFCGFLFGVSAQEKMVSRTINGASAVKTLLVRASVNVILDASCGEKIEIKVAQTLEQALFTELKGNVFTVAYKGNVKEQVAVSPKATIRLSAKNLEYLSARGDGTVTFKTPVSVSRLKVDLEHSMKLSGKFTASELYLKMGNTSSANCDVTAKYFDVAMSGVTRLTAKGNVPELKLHEIANASASLGNLLGIQILDLSLKGNSKANLKASGVAKIYLGGSSQLTSSLTLSNLTLSTNDSPGMALSGNASEAVVSLSGRNTFPGGQFSVAVKADVKCSGETAATVKCGGDIAVKASGKARITVPACGGILKVTAQNEAKILHPKGVKLNVVMVKDQATMQEL